MKVFPIDSSALSPSFPSRSISHQSPRNVCQKRKCSAFGHPQSNRLKIDLLIVPNHKKSCHSKHWPECRPTSPTLSQFKKEHDTQVSRKGQRHDWITGSGMTSIVLNNAIALMLLKQDQQQISFDKKATRYIPLLCSQGLGYPQLISSLETPSAITSWKSKCKRQLPWWESMGATWKNISTYISSCCFKNVGNPSPSDSPNQSSK